MYWQIDRPRLSHRLGHLGTQPLGEHPRRLPHLASLAHDRQPHTHAGQVRGSVERRDSREVVLAKGPVEDIGFVSLGGGEADDALNWMSALSKHTKLTAVDLGDVHELGELHLELLTRQRRDLSLAFLPCLVGIVARTLLALLMLMLPLPLSPARPPPAPPHTLRLHLLRVRPTPPDGRPRIRLLAPLLEQPAVEPKYELRRQRLLLADLHVWRGIGQVGQTVEKEVELPLGALLVLRQDVQVRVLRLQLGGGRVVLVPREVDAVDHGDDAVELEALRLEGADLEGEGRGEGGAAGVSGREQTRAERKASEGLARG